MRTVKSPILISCVTLCILSISCARPVQSRWDYQSCESISPSYSVAKLTLPRDLTHPNLAFVLVKQEKQLLGRVEVDFPCVDVGENLEMDFSVEIFAGREQFQFSAPYCPAGKSISLPHEALETIIQALNRSEDVTLVVAEHQLLIPFEGFAREYSRFTEGEPLKKPKTLLDWIHIPSQYT